jgi:hypothetical protein
VAPTRSASAAQGWTAAAGRAAGRAAAAAPAGGFASCARSRAKPIMWARVVGEVAEAEVLIARDLEAFPHDREHFGLLDRVHAMAGFEVEVKFKHIS